MTTYYAYVLSSKAFSTLTVIKHYLFPTIIEVDESRSRKSYSQPFTGTVLAAAADHDDCADQVGWVRRSFREIWQQLIRLWEARHSSLCLSWPKYSSCWAWSGQDTNTTAGLRLPTDVMPIAKGKCKLLLNKANLEFVVLTLSRQEL